MVEIGKKNRLRVVKKVDFGLYLDGEDLGEILLPGRYVPESCHIGDMLEVFVYTDSDDLLIATTETPHVMVNQCALLKVVEVNQAGAFLDWGLPKDLILPYSEQQTPVDAGQSVIVYVFLDESTDRLAASTKLGNYLAETSTWFKPNQGVDLLICGQSDLGYKAVINNSHLGLLFKNEVFTSLEIGKRTKGYIKSMRDDHKIDLALQLSNQDSREALSDKILSYLKNHEGVSTLTDKSPPGEIYRQFSVSKASYKRALGSLYKQKLIRIDKKQITLL
ncbi:MAG TPA: GntR family transcriptional regulator [Gammaproteobacteria bacterium]|nr:GntR family transcriptional regulator [Gammaproteobacteria bacterium]